MSSQIIYTPFITPIEKDEQKIEGKVEETFFGKLWKNSDATIIVEDKVMYVHTIILSFASPVFERMFNSGFKESNEKKVELKEKKYKDVLHVIKMIYPQYKVDLGKCLLKRR